MSKRSGHPPNREASQGMSGTNLLQRPSDNGGEFRWSWDEIKGMFSRPFSGEGGSRSNSSRKARSAGGTPQTRSGGSSHGLSFFRMSQDFRWSFDDLKGMFSRSSSKTSSGLSHQQQQQQNAESDKKRKRERSKGKLTPEERAARKQQRMEHQRNKKITREKNRREKVHVLFDQLGGILGIGRQNRKGERNPTSSKVAILSSAIERVKSKKGIPQGSPAEQLRMSNGSHTMNDDLYLPDGKLPPPSTAPPKHGSIDIDESLLDAEDFLHMDL